MSVKVKIYMTSSFNFTAPLKFASNVPPRCREPSLNPIPVLSKPKRLWTLSEIEELETSAKALATQFNKPIRSLTLSDLSDLAHTLGKTPEQCSFKLKEVIITGTSRPGQWGLAEDQLLIQCIQQKMDWKACANTLNSAFFSDLTIRKAKQCKERWNNYLDPKKKKGQWSLEEDAELIQAFLEYGMAWSTIAKFIVTRNENAIKNRIKSLLKKENKEFGVADPEIAARRILARTQREIRAEYYSQNS